MDVYHDHHTFGMSYNLMVINVKCCNLAIIAYGVELPYRYCSNEVVFDSHYNYHCHSLQHNSLIILKECSFGMDIIHYYNIYYHYIILNNLGYNYCSVCFNINHDFHNCSGFTIVRMLPCSYLYFIFLFTIQFYFLWITIRYWPLHHIYHSSCEVMAFYSVNYCLNYEVLQNQVSQSYSQHYYKFLFQLFFSHFSQYFHFKIAL